MVAVWKIGLSERLDELAQAFERGLLDEVVAEEVVKDMAGLTAQVVVIA